MRGQWGIGHSAFVVVGLVTGLLLGFQNCSDAFRETPLIEDASIFEGSSAGGSRWLSSSLILSQPLPHDSYAGQPLMLNVDVKYPSGFGYQWKKNGVPIPNATGKTLTIASSSGADAGRYSVLVFNSQAQQEESAAVDVHVLPTPGAAIAPGISIQPQSQTEASGASLVLQVAYSGYPEPTFQWYKDGQVLAGQTGSVLRLDSLTLLSAGSYRVRLTNSAGATDSVATTVVVSQ